MDLQDVLLDVEVRAAGDTVVDAYTAADASCRWVEASLGGVLLNKARGPALCSTTALHLAGRAQPHVLGIVRVVVPCSQRVGDATRVS